MRYAAGISVLTLVLSVLARPQAESSDVATSAVATSAEPLTTQEVGTTDVASSPAATTIALSESDGATPTASGGTASSIGITTRISQSAAIPTAAVTTGVSSRASPAVAGSGTATKPSANASGSATAGGGTGTNSNNNTNSAGALVGSTAVVGLVGVVVGIALGM